MLAFQPAKPQPAMGRVVARPLGESTPPPGPDPIFTGYTGMVGWIETVLVLGVTSAAAWAGIRTGMGERSTALKAAGWVGGVGSALAGLLYLGAKSGFGGSIGLPAVRVTPY